MAIPRRTQVTLATLAVFLVSLVGLGAYSLSATLGRTGSTVKALPEATAIVSFTPAEVSGKIGEQAVIDVLLTGPSPVFAATIDFHYDPQYFSIKEVNTDQGILGDGTVGFDSDQGVVHVEFKPGKAITPSGRILTITVELARAGNASIDLLPTSHITAFNNSLLEPARLGANAAVAVSVHAK